MRFRQYSAIGHFPQDLQRRQPLHWGLKRLKHCVSLINQKVDGEATTLPYTGLEYIESWSGKRLTTPGLMEESEGQSCLFQNGDVLFGKLRPYLAKVWRADAPGVCTGELLVLRPTSLNQSFVFYFMLARDTIALIDSSTYGAKMPRANWDFIGNLPVIFPPLPEQKAIATFLDRETVKIDTLIAKKQEQIALLQKKRAALISRAVTKGLDPNVKMKDSKVEWLGKVPEKWRVVRIGYVVDLLTGFPFKSENYSTVDTFTKCVRGDNVTEGSLRWGDKLRTWAEVTSELEPYLLQANDVLIGMDGSKVGKNYAIVRSTDLPLLLVQRVARLRCEPEILPEYLFYLVGCDLFLNHVNRTKTDPAIPHISGKDIRDYQVALPPISQQKTILGYLSCHVACNDKLLHGINQSIDKLQQYRTALISAAVTGQIDVRQEVEVD